jgi:3-oxoacyl-[acyl-carrier protein] reductase
MDFQFNDLKNKRILITGTTSGIGRDIALCLAAQGAKLIVHARVESEKTQVLSQELTQLNATFEWTYFDITDFATMQTEVDRLLKSGPIEGLVNNAGVSKDQLIMRVKTEDINFILDTNLKSAIHLTSMLSKNFLRAQNASIVNISSVVGMMGNNSQSLYAASKAGLIGFSKSIAKELATKNIRSNVIAPGFIETTMTGALDEKVKEKYFASIPMGKFGTGQDVAQLCCFLLSQASKYITGEVIKIDGGLYI